jgi:DNA gyrase subunit A
VDRHGDDRRSEIDPMPLSMDREDLIEERAIVITLSQDGYVRHMPVDDFRVQNRGGKGLKGVTTKQEDTPMQIITCFSKDRLLIFTDQGRVYGLKAWEVPRGSRQARGSHVRNLLEGLREEERIINILPISKDVIEEPGDLDLVFATREGRVKRSRLQEYVRINRNGKFALKLATETDTLVGVRLLTKDDHVMLVTERAMAVRFHPAEQKEKVDKDTGETTVSETVRVQGRISQGVAGINLNEGDRVVGMIVATAHDTTILTITRNGMAKRSRLGDGEMHPAFDDNGDRKTGKDGEPGFERDGYRRSSRGTKGVRTMSMDDDDGIVVVRQVADLADQLFLLTEKGMMMRMPAHQSKETKGRVSKGTRLIELRNSKKDGYADQVIFAARLPAGLLDDEEEE